MKLRHVLAGVVLLGTAMAAQAANYQMVAGQNMDFYYDTDYWGANSASVFNNTITFNTTGYDASATSFGTRNRTEYVHESASPGIVVVAHSSYLLAPVLQATSLGTYTLAANGGHVELNLAGSLGTGTFTGGVYSPTADFIGGYFSGAFKDSNGIAGSGTLGKSDFAFNTGGPDRSILGVEISLTALASQTGLGTTSADLSSASYQFYVGSVVPEPATYAMMGAGLALLAVCARRRRS